MEILEVLMVGIILAAFITFASVLGWAAHIDYKRPDAPLAGD